MHVRRKNEFLLQVLGLVQLRHQYLATLVIMTDHTIIIVVDTIMVGFIVMDIIFIEDKDSAVDTSIVMDIDTITGIAIAQE